MYQSSGWWLTVAVALIMVGLGLLAANLRRNRPALMRAGFVVIAIAMLHVPSVWSELTMAYASGQTLPQAYGHTNGGASSSWAFSSQLQTLTGSGQRQSAQRGGMVQAVNQRLLTYLEANTQRTKYLMVVTSSQQGEGHVLATGRPVLYAGGFCSSDPVIDGTSLAALVYNGDVRYVLWGGGGPVGSNTTISSYLQSSCTVVNNASLGESASSTTNQGRTGGAGFGGGHGNQGTLYQCGA
jgi:hypothetical protein